MKSLKKAMKAEAAAPEAVTLQPEAREMPEVITTRMMTELIPMRRMFSWGSLWR